jgi:hypothetical protein
MRAIVMALRVVGFVNVRLHDRILLWLQHCNVDASQHEVNRLETLLRNKQPGRSGKKLRALQKQLTAARKRLAYKQLQASRLTNQKTKVAPHLSNKVAKVTA